MPIDITKNECRKRQTNPNKFDKRSFRSKKVSKRTRIIIGCPRGKYNQKTKKCKVGTKIQSIIKKKNKDGTCPK